MNLSPYEILPIAKYTGYFFYFYLFIYLFIYLFCVCVCKGVILLSDYEIVCCAYSLESPHQDDSAEYTQHTTIL